MSLYLKGLLPDTLRALQDIAAKHGWPDINHNTDPETVWYFALRLEFEEDSPDNFPHGKWATIQRLQMLVRDHLTDPMFRAQND